MQIRKIYNIIKYILSILDKMYLIILLDLPNLHAITLGANSLDNVKEFVLYSISIN